MMSRVNDVFLLSELKPAPSEFSVKNLFTEFYYLGLHNNFVLDNPPQKSKQLFPFYMISDEIMQFKKQIKPKTELPYDLWGDFQNFCWPLYQGEGAYGQRQGTPLNESPVHCICEHLGVQKLAEGYVVGALRVPWHLPLFLPGLEPTTLCFLRIN